jgi:hypothetical protein
VPNPKAQPSVDTEVDNQKLPVPAESAPAAPGADAPVRRRWRCSRRKDQICTLPNGRKLTIRQLAERLGLTYGILFRELVQADWRVEQVLLKYPKRSVLTRRAPEVPGDS